MKVAAIIAEYNPFHNGHKYLIDETRRLTGADYILAVMSGDFVQRGAPALCNKYLRTQMALSCGVDAVIELPAFYSLSSAEFFASGSISLLNQLGIIDILSFGSESGSIDTLMQVADRLREESITDSTHFLEFLKAGHSYPTAKAALLEEPFRDSLSTPNNILGIEYCKALKHSGSRILPFTISRVGNDYHNSSLSKDVSVYSSASAIRKVLESADSANESVLSAIRSHVPEAVFQLIQNNRIENSYVTTDDFSSLLHYKLLCEQKDGFSGYLDCTPDLSDKICKHLPDFTTISDFTARLKSKDLTYTRISRVLFHILLNVTYPEWCQNITSFPTFPVHYARLLGFRKDARPLLSAIRKNSCIPLISKLADASTYLDSCAYQSLTQDIFCAFVYETAHFHKTGLPALNEFRQSPIIIS